MAWGGLRLKGWAGRRGRKAALPNAILCRGAGIVPDPE